MDGYTVQIGDGTLEVPWWWLDAVLAWLGLVGLVLLFLGRRLVKPSIGALGMILGAASALIIGIAWVSPRWPEVPPAAIAIIGGILGAIAGALLWRVGIGVILALAVGLIAPLVWLIITQTPGPEYEEVTARFHTNANLALNAAPADGEGEDDPQAMGEAILPADILIPAREARDGLVDATTTWWESRTNDERWMIGTIGVGGALIAALVGLALPYFSATFVTSLVGSLMLMGLAYRVQDRFAADEAGFLPSAPTGFFYLLMSATLVGVVLQWTLFRPAKKKAE